MIYKIYRMQMMDRDGNLVHPVNPVELSWMGNGLRLPPRRDGIMVRSGGKHLTYEAQDGSITTTFPGGVTVNVENPCQ